jgi:signal transduction histidine kinase
MRHEIELEPHDLNALVTEVLAFLRGEMAGRGIVAETALAPRLPALQLDRVQIQQALVNLCVNAMDAMAETASGDRRLEVRTRPRADQMIEIRVSDRGPGISPEQLPRLFDSFFTTKPSGTGLGLSITRSIVEAHGGTLQAENRSGGGGTFIIALPVADRGMPVPKAVSAEPAPRSAA